MKYLLPLLLLVIMFNSKEFSNKNYALSVINYGQMLGGQLFNYRSNSYAPVILEGTDENLTGNGVDPRTGRPFSLNVDQFGNLNVWEY